MKRSFAALSPLLLALCVGCGPAAKTDPTVVSTLGQASTPGITQRTSTTPTVSPGRSGSAEATVGGTEYAFALSSCDWLGPQAEGIADDGTTLRVNGRGSRVELHGPALDFVGGISEWALNFGGYTASGREVSSHRQWSITLNCH